MNSLAKLPKWTLVFLAAATLGAPLSAGEPASEFLTGLRQSGYHDLALHYLDQMEGSKLAPPEFKEVIAYERAVTLIEGSRMQRDFKVREQWLDDGNSKLKEFVEKQPDHPQNLPARNQLGNVLIERSRIKQARAKTPSGQTQAKQLNVEARDLLKQAAEVFKKNLELVRGRLEKMGDDYKALEERVKNRDRDAPEELKELTAARDELRSYYVQTKLVTAAVVYEIAGTFKKDNKAEYEKHVKEAGEAYADVADKYGNKLAGLYAGMLCGRCHLDLGEYEDAMIYFEDLMLRPDQPAEFRTLKTRTFKLAIDCWMVQGGLKNLSLAIEKAGEWLGKGQPNEEKTEDWLTLRLAYVKACWARSKEEKADSRTVKSDQAAARKEIRYVIRYAVGDLKDEAQDFFQQEMGGPSDAEDELEPQNFVEAVEAGTEAIELMSGLQRAVPILKQQVAREKDPEEKKKLQATLADSEKKLEKAQQDAFKYFKAAMELVDDESELHQVNRARYFFCYLLYLNEEFQASAVVGEFLARHYPQAAGSRQCAKIAMAAYLKLFSENQSDDKTFEMERLVSVAEYIANRWPDQPEAQEALVQLVTFMIRLGRLDEAEQYLERIPPEASARGDAELKTGQALWGNYLRGMRALREALEADPDLADRQQQEEQLEQMKQRSQKVLAAGIERMREQGVTSTILHAGLSLSQIYVGTDQADKAVALLEDPNVGPITWVQDPKKDLAKIKGFEDDRIRNTFIEGVFRTALQAYVGSLANATNAEETIGKAVAVMDGLKKQVGDTEEGRRRLIGIYVRLANDLQESMLNAPPEQRDALAKGFETFLNRLGDTSDEFNVLYWVAETFYGMGQGYSADAADAARAKSYFQKASRGFEKILKKHQDETLKLEPRMLTQVQMRQAMCRREMGEFDKSIDLFADILTRHEFMISVQVETAYTFQYWAAVGEPDRYNKAIMGDRQKAGSNRNLIWGWGQIATITARDYQKYRETFHEARYNQALCRFSYAMRLGGDDRTKYLKMAKTDIEATRHLYPDLGGETWWAKYDALLKKIQNALGEAAAGLGEYIPMPVEEETPDPPAAEVDATDQDPTATEQPEETATEEETE